MLNKVTIKSSPFKPVPGLDSYTSNSFTMSADRPSPFAIRSRVVDPSEWNATSAYTAPNLKGPKASSRKSK